MLKNKYNKKLQDIDNQASSASQVNTESELIDLSTEINIMLNVENSISNSMTCKSDTVFSIHHKWKLNFDILIIVLID